MFHLPLVDFSPYLNFWNEKPTIESHPSQSKSYVSAMSASIASLYYEIMASLSSPLSFYGPIKQFQLSSTYKWQQQQNNYLKIFEDRLINRSINFRRKFDKPLNLEKLSQLFDKVNQFNPLKGIWTFDKEAGFKNPTNGKEGLCFGMSLDFIARVFALRGESSLFKRIRQASEAFSQGATDKAVRIQIVLNHLQPSKDLLLTLEKLNKKFKIDDTQFKALIDPSQALFIAANLKKVLATKEFPLDKVARNNLEQLSFIDSKLPNGVYFVRIEEHALVYIKEGPGFIFDPTNGIGSVSETLHSTNKQFAEQMIKILENTPTSMIQFYKVEPFSKSNGIVPPHNPVLQPSSSTAGSSSELGNRIQQIIRQENPRIRHSLSSSQ